MQTIQVVIDEPLLRAADRAAQQSGVNRSALMRNALREYLKGLALREKERRDREGYERVPDRAGDLDRWEQVAKWPDT